MSPVARGQAEVEEEDLDEDRRPPEDHDVARHERADGSVSPDLREPAHDADGQGATIESAVAASVRARPRRRAGRASTTIWPNPDCVAASVLRYPIKRELSQGG